MGRVAAARVHRKAGWWMMHLTGVPWCGSLCWDPCWSALQGLASSDLSVGVGSSLTRLDVSETGRRSVV